MRMRTRMRTQETETIFMYSAPSVTVAMDGDDAAAVEESNARYGTLLAAKQAADNYADAAAQTLNLMTKAREVQSAVLETASAECQATVWDIADTYCELEGAADAEDGADNLNTGRNLNTG